MFTTLFWKDVGERAGKTFTQTLLGTLTATGVSYATIGWKAALISAGMAALYSVLTSVLSVAAPGSDGRTASLVRAIRHGKHEAGHPPTQQGEPT